MSAVAEELVSETKNLPSEYSETEAGLAELEARLKGVVVDVTTKQGMTAARADRKECVTLRTSLDRLRKQKNEDDQLRIKRRNEVAKNITERIVALEEPIDEAILAEEQRIETEKAERVRVEQERVKAIQLRVQMLRTAIMAAVGVDSAAIKAKLAEVEALEVSDENFAEFIDEAFIAKRDALEGLQKALAARLTHEAEEARVATERAELRALQDAEDERQRKAKAERDEAERIEREATEARQREADEQQRKEREQLDADRAELDRQQAQFAKDRAEAQATKDREAAAAAERLNRSKAATSSKRNPSPGAVEIVKLIAKTYTVHEAVALVWISEMDLNAVASEMGVSINKTVAK